MKIFDFDAVVIGSGAAGYNAADRLYENGVTSVAVITEGKNAGTSRNTGSDKQTYYKLSLAGDDGDSIGKMAKTLFDGGAMDGDIALIEAAYSARCFMRLVELGVEFPANEFGEFVGYKTDHDPYSRATSIGPYTSKKMTEALESSVIKKGIAILDGLIAIKILKSDESLVGVLSITASGNELVAIRSPYVIMATGGPAGVYYDSVYPACHTGSSSLALIAGAEFSNLAEWQYGLASTDFRWNVSGSYQQVLPRYISVDESGNEKEFLYDYISSPKEVLSRVFLKGYEWPFDVRKDKGSSLIDLIVYNESVIKGRSVYLDYRKDPIGIDDDFSSLSEECKNYLKNSGALVKTPIERLKRLNPKAIELYQANGINIEREPLKIAVCAQHNNGGIRVDSNWQTTVDGLYAVGECAGTLGIYRPGGSALNSTQVGSMRAAMHIARRDKRIIGKEFDNILSLAIKEAETLINATKGERGSVISERERYQKLMSRSFAFLRNIKDMESSLEEIKTSLDTFTATNKWKSEFEIPEIFKNHDIVHMQYLIASAMIYTAKRYGSRGSALVTKNGDFLHGEKIEENESGRGFIVTANGLIPEISERAVNPIPERDLWFESVWNKSKEL